MRENPAQIPISGWCKKHWRIYQDPIVVRLLIAALRDRLIEVPQHVLRHLPDGAFPHDEKGYVYVIEVVSENGEVELFDDGAGNQRPWIKVGSTRDPKARLRELNKYETRGLSEKFHLIALIERGNARRLEEYFHRVADWLGLTVPGELCDMPAPLASELLATMAEWMGYAFEQKPLMGCPCLLSLIHI